MPVPLRGLLGVIPFKTTCQTFSNNPLRQTQFYHSFMAYHGGLYSFSPDVPSEIIRQCEYCHLVLALCCFMNLFIMKHVCVYVCVWGSGLNLLLTCVNVCFRIIWSQCLRWLCCPETAFNFSFDVLNFCRFQSNGFLVYQGANRVIGYILILIKNKAYLSALQVVFESF